jgi:hypothetical protein
VDNLFGEFSWIQQSTLHRQGSKDSKAIKAIASESDSISFGPKTTIENALIKGHFL